MAKIAFDLQRLPIRSHDGSTSERSVRAGSGLPAGRCGPACRWWTRRPEKGGMRARSAKDSSVSWRPRLGVTWSLVPWRRQGTSDQVTGTSDQVRQVGGPGIGSNSFDRARRFGPGQFCHAAKKYITRFKIMQAQKTTEIRSLASSAFYKFNICISHNAGRRGRIRFRSRAIGLR